MEVWEAGLSVSPGRILTGVAATYLLLCGFNAFAGLRFDANLKEVAVDSVEEARGANANQFVRTTVNGFRVELLTEIHDRHFGEVVCTYKVQNPEGGTETVKVIVPQYLIELVKAHCDTETVPCQNRFWQALSEEALASYLWQESAFPPDNMLKVKELSPAIKRWVDAVMTVGAEDANA